MTKVPHLNTVGAVVYAAFEPLKTAAACAPPSVSAISFRENSASLRELYVISTPSSLADCSCASDMSIPITLRPMDLAYWIAIRAG